MKWLNGRNIYYNNIRESEGSNKTSKSLANKISDKWDLKFKINHYFLKLYIKGYIYFGQPWTGTCERVSLVGPTSHSRWVNPPLI